jgi:hypothetical protein
MSKLSAEERKQLELGARPDGEIDLWEIPEILEIPPNAVIGNIASRNQPRMTANAAKPLAQAPG